MCSPPASCCSMRRLCVVYANVGAQDLLGLSLRQARGLRSASCSRTRRRCSNCCSARSATARPVAGHEFALTPIALLQAARAPAVVDITVTPLGEPERRTAAAARAGRRAGAPAHRARERVARARRRQPADDAAAGARDQKSARRPARRGAAAGARAATTTALKEYTTVIISEADRLRALVDTHARALRPAAQAPAQRARDLRARVPAAAQRGAARA